MMETITIRSRQYRATVVIQPHPDWMYGNEMLVTFIFDKDGEATVEHFPDDSLGFSMHRIGTAPEREGEGR